MTRAGLLLAALAAGCALPPGGERGIPAGAGLLPSSEVKPPRAARGPLPLEAQSAARSALKQRYFAELAAGRATAAAKAALLPAEAPLAAGTRDLRAGALALVALELREGEPLELETVALSPGADPVLHLLVVEEGRLRELARDDDGGGEPGAARLRASAARDGLHLALVRAFASEDGGECELRRSGASLGRIRFGGSLLRVRAGRTLHAVLLNDGAAAAPAPRRAASDTLLLALDDAGALVALDSGVALDDDGGVELGSELTLPAGEDRLVLLAALDADAEGAARLVVNDRAQKDSDGDGLGDGLEAALCLCDGAAASACGFACEKARTAEDSDGDGLSDAAELLGVDHPRFPQLLPRWGANPRHKDLFVEVDLARWTDRKLVPPVEHTGRTPTSEEAHLAARVFARLDAMENPDGVEGIALHVDLDHGCGLLASGIDEVCGPFCAHGRDGVRRCGSSFYPGPPAEGRDGLSEERRNLFHVAVADCLVSGVAPGQPADYLEYDCDRVTAMVHELGHNLGLSFHYGLPTTGTGNCKPNYPSLMNYAFSDRFAGAKEVQFSRGEAAELDPRNLDETARFGGASGDASWLQARPFYYQLHDCLSPGRGCKVDWNRDGRLDPSVRAYLSPMPGYGFICEGLHGNALGSENLEGLAASGGPAGGELPRRRADGTLAPALHVIAPARDGDGSALSLNHTFSESGRWQGWTPLGGPRFRADAAPAALVLGEGAAARLWLFACVEGESPIRYATLDPEGALSAWQTVPGQPAGLRAREVSLAARGPDLLLAVRDERPEAADAIYLALHTPGAGFGAFSAASLGPGRPLRSTVTPALARAPDGRIYLVAGDPAPLVGPPGRLHLLSAAEGEPGLFRDEELEGLRFEDGVPDHQHELWSRPALAFVPLLDGLGMPLGSARGALVLWWVRGVRTRHLRSWGRLDASGADFSLGRWHHYEAWGYTDAIAGSGPALVTRAGGRLVALLAQSDLVPARVRHVPYADGIPGEPLVSRDFDDRPPIRESLCASLNWECPARCKRLADACRASQSAKPPLERCTLPRLAEEALP